jgi:hypothetical protein
MKKSENFVLKMQQALMIIPRQFGFNYPSGFREEAF